MRIVALFVVGAAFVATAAATTAVAQDARTRLMESRFWSAFKMQPAEGSVCWAATTPTQSNYSQNPGTVGETFLMASYRPRAGVSGEISIISGVPFDESRPVTVQIGRSSFTLFAVGDGAWVEGEQEERRLFSAMRGGASAIVTAGVTGGSRVEHTFSLAGFTAASNAAQAACR